MSTVFVECWKCDACGHRWIKGEIWPETCAKKACRSRKWNKDAVRSAEPVASVPTVAVDPVPSVPVADVAALPVVDRLAIARAALQSVAEPRGELIPPSTSALPVCGFVAFNDVDGEDYRCTLPKHPFPKVKHGGWVRV